MHEDEYLAKQYLLGIIPCGRCKYYDEELETVHDLSQTSSVCMKIRDGTMSSRDFVEVFISKYCPHFAYLDKDNTKE